MSALQAQHNPPTSPFDAIRRVDERGEHWSARELMPLMGYSRWQTFEVPLKRAIQAATNTGDDVTSHFTRSSKVVDRRQGGGVAQDDYRLTRYAAYLVALNGDPNKTEVAAAQAYFVTRTREAEAATRATGTALIRAMCDELDATNQRVLELVEADARRQVEVRQLAARVDGIESRYDWYTALAYAKMNGLPTARPYLQRLGTAAARITRRDGQQPVSTQDARFGSVGQYPVAALDEAAQIIEGKAA